MPSAVAPFLARELVVGAEPVTLPVDDSALSPDQRLAMEGLVDVVRRKPGGLLIRRRGYVVGRCVVGDWSVVVPPDFDPSLFLQLVLFAYELDPQLRTQRNLVGVTAGAASNFDWFLRMMAALLVREAETVVAHHVAQSYETVEERSHNPKGRLLWERDFGHHPREGISHQHRLKTTDNLLNRLVLAGVRVATAALATSEMRGDANRQAFVWRELAAEITPRPADFIAANRGLDRLSEHYSTALVLSRALILGLTPHDYFSPARDVLVPAIRFNLASIFERFLERLVKRIAGADPRLAVRAQAPDQSALLDDRYSTYRSVRPDLVLFSSGKPKAVIDAKFKPRYAAPEGAARKVSNADIYQLLFYQSRVGQLAGKSFVPAAIVAPQLHDEPLSDVWTTSISWHRSDGPTHSVELIPLPLERVLRALAEGSREDLMLAAPALGRFLEASWLQAA